MGNGERVPIPDVVQTVLRRYLFSAVNSTLEDCAKTQVYLAGSHDVVDKDVHGEFWVPVLSWTMRFKSCKKEELRARHNDVREQAQKKLWDFSEEAIKAVSD